MDFEVAKKRAEELTKIIRHHNELYYVQVGAFRSKSNAEAFLLTVKERYPNAFIKVM